MNVKQCLNCGCDLQTTDKRRNCCSLKCAMVFRFKDQKSKTYLVKCDCGKQVVVKDPKQRFCSRSCSAIVNGKRRKQSDETKRKISQALKGRCVGWSKGKERHPKTCENCGGEFMPSRPSRKYCSHTCSLIGRGRKQLGKMSYRTFRKMLKRAFPNWGCPFCSWKESFDVHHIYGKGDNRAVSLVMLCPNHHSLADAKKIGAEELKPFAVGNKYTETELLEKFYKGSHKEMDVNISRNSVSSNYLRKVKVVFPPREQVG